MNLPVNVLFRVVNYLMNVIGMQAAIALSSVREKFRARFYDTKRDALLALGGQRSDPTIVLLTSGPHNETYFEQSFLEIAISETAGPKIFFHGRHLFGFCEEPIESDDC